MQRDADAAFAQQGSFETTFTKALEAQKYGDKPRSYLARSWRRLLGLNTQRR